MKITLSDVENLQNEASVVSTLKANNDTIEAAFDNTLSRDGSSPNAMAADLDMDSHRIVNLPDPTTDQEPVTKAYAEANFTGNGQANADAAAASAAAAATSETNAAASATAAAQSAIDAAAASGVASVLYDQAQSLTSGQKAQARSNIGLATVAASGDYTDLTNKPTLGTAAALDVGTSANKVVQLTAAAKLPAVDGSLLTNLPVGSVPIYATRAALLADSSSASEVIVLRYSTSTPYAPALYVKLGSTPSPVKAWHAGADAGGKYWELRTAAIQPEMLGAVGDGSTDDYNPCQYCLDYVVVFPAKILLTRFYFLSLGIGHSDGVDPGACIIEGVGFDTCGFVSNASNNCLTFPVTGSNRHSGLRFSNFRLSGTNSAWKGIYVNNALDCIFDHIHIVGFCNHAFHFDYTSGYGHLRVTIKDCKTSPTSGAAGVVSGCSAVRIDAGNYLTLQNNYFSGYVDASHRLTDLVWTSGDSTHMYNNIIESCGNGVHVEGGSFVSVGDSPVGSTITGNHYVFASNNAATLIAPRGTADANIDASGITTATYNKMLEA